MGGDDDVQMRDYGSSFQREDKDRVLEWEDGLPNLDDLTPLSQYMISSELASAFRITPEPFRSVNEVNRASQTTLTSIRRHNSDNFKSSMPVFTEDQSPDPVVVEGDEDEEAETEEISMKDGSDSRKVRRTENNIEGDHSALGGPENSKRPRLVWTPQLHKRFVDVVGHLGIKSAVPKTIMQLMNVEGLTRENVASHLQKYRLYLKRMQGLSNEGPSSSDPLFATTPVPQNFQESNGQGNVPIHPMSYGGGSMMSMPVQGVGHGHGHTGNQGGNSGPSSYHGFQSHQYNMLREQQREWSGHMFNSMSSYAYVNPNDK